MNYPTIKQHKYYIELAEYNHFENSTHSCFVSQSPFSRTLELGILHIIASFLLAFQAGCKCLIKKGGIHIPSNDSVLLLEGGHYMSVHALSACKTKSLNTIKQFSASRVLTLVALVKSGIGINYLPGMSLSSNLIQQSRLIIQLLDKNSYRRIGLVWRKGSLKANEFNQLGEFIKSRLV